MTFDWQFWSALAASVWAAATYLERRRAELAWKRTEFLFTQAWLLDSDPDLREVLRVLEGRRGDVSFAAILGDDPSLAPAARAEWRQQLDKFLNFFDRLYYAVYTAKTLRRSELAVFGWYLTRIGRDPALIAYCQRHGFEDVITLARDAGATPVVS